MAEDFGAFITSRRRELELTLGDVATELEVSPITVSNWSNGQAAPDSDQLQALAELLEVPADELSTMAGVLSDDVPPLTEASVEAEPEAGNEDIELLEVGPATAAAEEVEIPEAPEAEPEPPAATSEIDHELAEMIEEASAEVAVQPELDIPDAEVPASVEPPADPVPPPAPARPRRRSRAATATAERPVSTLPVTYIEDPKQLMRYRIRWGLTVVVLAVMFLILLWAAGGLISALSEVKESVTPGGGS